MTSTKRGTAKLGSRSKGLVVLVSLNLKPQKWRCRETQVDPHVVQLKL